MAPEDPKAKALGKNQFLEKMFPFGTPFDENHGASDEPRSIVVRSSTLAR